jgi:hypothetical protein
MDTLITDRRATGPYGDAHFPQSDASRVVQQGLLIQARLGTISAVEFLKANDVGSVVIQRVLTSQQVRANDRA